MTFTRVNVTIHIASSDSFVSGNEVDRLYSLLSLESRLQTYSICGDGPNSKTGANPSASLLPVLAHRWWFTILVANVGNFQNFFDRTDPLSYSVPSERGSAQPRGRNLSWMYCWPASSRKFSFTQSDGLKSSSPPSYLSNSGDEELARLINQKRRQSHALN